MTTNRGGSTLTAQPPLTPGAPGGSSGLADLLAPVTRAQPLPAETLGTYAEPALRLDGHTRVPELDARFRRDPALTCLVVSSPGLDAVVDRAWFDAWMSGPLGYGRAVHHRSLLVDIDFPASLVLDAGISIEDAALALLDQDGRALAANVGVRWPDGRIDTVPTTRVFAGLYRRYAFQAIHDPLTGLPNRIFLDRHLRRGAEAGEPMAALYLDLDRFKDVNDRYGHAAGDQVLTAFSRRLQRVARPGELVIRLGGDEFVVLLDPEVEPLRPDDLAEQIVAEAARPFTITVAGDPAGGTAPAGLTQVQVRVGASLGLAVSAGGPAGIPPHQVLNQADLAMYQAKATGRGRVCRFDARLAAGPQERSQVHERHTLERRLREALAHGDLRLHYQPLLDLTSGRVVGVEALARWTDPELGPVSPAEFIAVAEDSGLIIDLGRWALHQACADAQRWAAELGEAAPRVSVNVSALQLAQPSFIADVTGALTRSGLAPQRLCLEITETAAVADLTETARRLARLRATGVTVALDDFGTGHSSLTMLQRLPVDTVKIDKSFVDRITEDAEDALLAHLIIDAAHIKGMSVCAEGVETAAQAAQLAGMSCDLIQGWLVARAQPADELVQWIRQYAGRERPATVPEPAPLPLDSADQLIIVTDDAHRITYISSSCLPILGDLPSELLHRSVFDRTHPDDLEQLRATRMASHHQDGTTYRVRGKDGQYRWLHCRTRRVASGEQGRWQLMLVCRDVTRMTQLEQENARLREQLARMH